MSRSRTACGFVVTAAVSGLLVALPAVTSAAAPSAAPKSGNDCPAALPTAEAVDGVTGTGYTVEKGTKADPFTATVIGRLTDGIAPGIDMIMADLDSPALKRAGGVWSGMSGSPVYTADGELIGSVSYGLASPSSIAGITPAEDMLELRNDPSNARKAPVTANRQIAVPADQAARIAKTGKAAKALAVKGFKRLSVPVTASGLATKNTTKFLANITKDSGQAVRSTAGKSASGKSSPSEIFAGSNYAAAFSYGDITLSALGTTTYVCDDTAVAFGHPFYSNGNVDYSVHPAQALYIQPDPLFGPFKVGNLGGPVGTVTWDGTVGLRSTLGQAPEHQFPVTTSLVNDHGKTTTGKTVGVYQPYAADIGALHLQSAIVKALGAQAAGSSEVKIVINGTRANGKKFKITHEDHFADTYDISYATADSLYFLLSDLAGQPFEEGVDITGIKITGSVSTTVKQYRVSKVETKEKGKWVALKNEVQTSAGASIPLRATLKGYRSNDSVTVTLTVPVPKGTSGYSGQLSISDGRSAGYSYEEPESLDALIKILNATPGNDSLVSRVDLDTPEEGTTVTSTREADVDAAVDYYSTYVPVTVQ